jgi:hypothetical protein
MFIIFSDIKGIVYKEFILAGQTVSSAYFAQNFGDKRTGCCITTTHRLTLPFSPENLLPKTDTTEVIETESQAVLKTLTEHNFQDAFKKWQKRWERCIRTDGKYCESVGGQ